MKQEQVRSNPEVGSYEDGTKAGSASWMACSIQLASLASWTDPTRRKGELVDASGQTRPFGEVNDGCFVVRDPLSEALSNLSRRFIV
ncbi:hypothetical protein Bca4012_072605 [Brassica carinata]